ncbi:MAG: ribosome recycling factor [Gammaproteobacteria bacterium]|nr:ribosome recycling factor [Gammaproteobacteria bacterium]
MIDSIYSDMHSRMDKSIASLHDELKKLRTGRAHTSLLDHIMVSYYGNDVPLTQAATVTVEDARTLSISPWEKAMAPVIEKAVMASDLGLTPTSAGTVIRVPLPVLTEERRRDLIKVVKQEGENARIAIRNIRRDGLSEIKSLLKSKQIAEDDERRAAENVQNITDEHIKKVDQVLDDKEKELLEI